jgi:hypothetical protein
MSEMETQDRSHLDFKEQVRSAFTFLKEAGYVEIEALPTLVRYQMGGVELDVYHGRQSYEIGAEITRFNTPYSISEIIRAIDSQEAKSYRSYVATTPEGVVAGLEELRSTLRRYGAAALQGDQHFFSMLEVQRKHWAEEYALDVLADQLRPKAEDAFRAGDYARAAELYARIRARLSPAETIKLRLSEERGKLANKE